MRKRIYAGITLAALFSGQALANEKLTWCWTGISIPTTRRSWWLNRLAPLKRRGWTLKLCHRPTRRCRRD